MKCGFLECFEPETTRQCAVCGGVSHHACSNEHANTHNVEFRDQVVCSIECFNKFSGETNALGNEGMIAKSSPIPEKEVVKIGQRKIGGRKRNPTRLHFGVEYTDPQFKSKRVRCVHCEVGVSATSINMKTHSANCSKTPRTIGRLDAGVMKGLDVLQEKPISLLLKAKVFPSISSADNRILNRAFADAIHENAVQFEAFDHPAWQNFFHLLNPCWKMPSPTTISNDLLVESYTQQQLAVLKTLATAPAVILGIDGATNVLSRSLSNVIAHDPRPWFLEYMQSDLRKETEIVLAEKVADIIHRLHFTVGRSVVCGFISDSCNVMKALRRCLLSRKMVDFAYGCGSHPLNNLCEDILKMDTHKETMKHALFVSKTIKNQGLLNKIYSSLCQESIGKVLSMVLYSASRWSSINYMFCRLKRVKRPIMSLPLVIANEKTEREIDLTYELPPSFSAIVTRSGFWNGVEASISIFDPICKCLGAMESDTATMSTAYACFIYVYAHVTSTVVKLPERAHILKCLLYRWDRIYTPVHALAFYCDPFYFQLRKNVAAKLGSTAIELGHGNIKTQCRQGLVVMASRHETPDGSVAVQDALVAEFLRFCLSERQILADAQGIITFTPRLIWSQFTDEYPKLSDVLIKVYTGPASTAGVERQHKVGKRVHTSRRNRTGAGKVEQQVAIAHNASTRRRVFPDKRDGFEIVVGGLCSLSDANPTATNEMELAEQDNADDMVDPIELLLTHSELDEQDKLDYILECPLMPEEILDVQIFGENE